MRGLVLLLLLLAAPVRAEVILDERSPGFSALVELSEAARAEPGFRAFLREEAEATVALWRDIARERPVTLAIRDEDRFVSADYLSVRRVIEAGGTVSVEALTIDRRTGAFLRLDAFLAGPGGGAALRAIAADLRRRIVADHHAGAPPADWTAPIAGASVPDLAVLQNFTLVPEAASRRIAAFAFQFGPGEVAPEARGPVEVSVPVAVFAAGLAPGVRDRFAAP